MTRVTSKSIPKLAERFFKSVFYSGKVEILEENPSRYVKFQLPNGEKYLVEFHNLESLKEIVSVTYLSEETALPEFSKDWAELVVDRRSNEASFYKSHSSSENSKFLLDAFISWLESEGIYLKRT